MYWQTIDVYYLPKCSNNRHGCSDNDQPWDHSIKFHLHRVGCHLLVLESVNEPNSHVEQYQENNYLPPWPVIFVSALSVQNLFRNKAFF